MKKILAAMVMATVLAGGAFAASIKLNPPVVTSWTNVPVTVTSGGYSVSTTVNVDSSYLSTVNSTLASLFSSIESDLNTNTFSKFQSQNDLAKGFANANSAAFDNASLLGFQTYDLFALMIGSNISVAVPGSSAAALNSALNDLPNKGDVYVGMSTGGFAGQVGVNTSSFLVKDLYLSAKVGVFPAVTYSGDNGASVTFQQGMFGVGANYTLVPQSDFLVGLLKWRGVSVGSGLIYNTNTTTVNLTIPNKTSAQSVSLGAAGTKNVVANLTNIKAKLAVSDSSLVIPLEAMTSVQLLWIFNLGVGAGVDVVFGGSGISAGGDAAIGVAAGANSGTITANPGSVALTVSDTKNGGDLFVPRLAASLGFDIAIFKIDIPVSYYPTTKALAAGISAGIVW